MHFMRLQRSVNRRWLSSSILLIVLFFSVACASSSQSNASRPSSSPVVNNAALPGQQIWKQGASSFLFGTNDTQEWSDNNIETNSGLQQDLKNAHFTLMRTFFFDKSLADGHATTDAEIEQRLKTIENSGMTCLGVLHNIFNVSFDEHVVAYAGQRCQLYEFGNEPDYNNIPVTDYVQQWNKVIPILRHINPKAKFIGPVVAYTLEYIQQFLTSVKASNVLPDAVSLHWYGCYQLSEEQCLTKASEIGSIIPQVRQIMQETIGRDLPIGVSEWNFDSGNPPPSYGGDKNFITQFTAQALQSMIQAGVTFACQFDAASYSGYGALDMFDVNTNQPKSQYFAMASVIAQYRPTGST